LLAIADGHGGDKTSSYVAGQLLDGLFETMMGTGTKNYDEALRLTFQYLNDSTLELSRKTLAHYESGTTLSLAYIPDGDNNLHIGIIGDSPVILAKLDGTFHISPDHNARSNELERNAAEQRGGVFQDGYLYSRSRGGKGLQMTRDIGCHFMGDVLQRHPDIYELGIHHGEVLILGSDGLLDPAHSGGDEEVRRLVRLVLDGAEAQDLVNDALNRETGDNVSAIVCRP